MTHEECLVVFMAVQTLVEIGNCSFEDMRVSISCQLGLKMPIHAPFQGVLGVKIGVTGNFLQFFLSR